MQGDEIVRVEGVGIRDSAGNWLVRDATFTVAEGEVVGLVGESGSGKTSLGLALLGYARPGTRVTTGRIVVGGKDVGSLSPRELRALRGSDVAYVPQDAAAALNPALRIGVQLRECLPPGLDRAQVTDAIDRVFQDVDLPGGSSFARRYPHELSGGQRQRVGIAMALIGRPRVVVFDEPTTGLDVTTQATVLDSVQELCSARSLAAVYISHDLTTVRLVADRTVVMNQGQLVEVGPTVRVLGEPRHPYTARLIDAVPDLDGRAALPTEPYQADGARGQLCPIRAGCPRRTEACLTTVVPWADDGAEAAHAWRCFHPVEPAVGAPARAAGVRDRGVAAGPDASSALQVSGLGVAYGDHQVLDGLDFEMAPGAAVTLLGESGSGKTTLARCIGGLHEGYRGTIRLGGEVLSHGAWNRTPDQRRHIQYVFQDPYTSLNPKKTVRQVLSEPLELLRGMSRQDARREVDVLLDLVTLGSRFADVYPGMLSGGERQRVAIARALAAEPQLLICDEITSALDVSVQASVVTLLNTLRAERGLSILFVTHNIALARHVGSEIAVMHRGTIQERGSCADVLERPKSDYAKTLIAHVLSL